jgi:glycosyltransferase involved in cell wall biosynthesis
MPQKNLVELVEILALVKDVPWKCIMVGDGPLLEEVKRTIATHNLEKRFTLPGWVTTQQVLAFLAQSDLLFMPSLSEGLPVVGLQALTVGLAIVASRVGGNVDLVKEGSNGILAYPSDRNTFSSALRSLLSNQEALLGARQASHDLAGRFDIRIVVDKYETIFRKILNG